MKSSRPVSSTQRLTLMTALVAATILSVPAWVWGNCCCVVRRSVGNDQAAHACCQKRAERASSRKRARLPRWQQECHCEIDLSGWQATRAEPATVDREAWAVLVLVGPPRVVLTPDVRTETEAIISPGRAGPRRHVELCCWLS